MSRKRSNKTQQEMLAEHLHSNLELARGSTANPEVAAFWTALAIALNKVGCKRTVAEWQFIWTQWVQKVKSRLRKYKNQIQGIDGSPSVLRPLTDIELKVLEIVSPAAVDGYGKFETVFVASGENTSLSASAVEVPPAAVQQPAAVQPSSNPAQSPSTSPSSTRRTSTQHMTHPYISSFRRRQRMMRPRPRPEELLSDSDRNNELFRSTITQAAETLAQAVREAGEAIASAIRDYSIDTL